MTHNAPYNCLVVLGPTASGKTRVACQLAYHLGAEIISADSRQVYKHLNIGSGKDLNEYVVNQTPIAYHLIDLVEPEEQFFLHQFAEKLEETFRDITARGKLPLVCGGTGLYLEALTKDFSFTQIKENPELRQQLSGLNKDELVNRLQLYPKELWSHVDLHSKKRLLRGIEIADYLREHPGAVQTRTLPYRPFYLGIKTEVLQRRENISKRLKQRLESGLIEEVQTLLARGVTHERLEFFGLEYKFVSRYLQHQISREDLFTQLQTAIFQFAKRQMTWFRKMEKEGITIHWFDPAQGAEPILAQLEQEGVVASK